jgi:hypothetical protein
VAPAQLFLQPTKFRSRERFSLARKKTRERTPLKGSGELTNKTIFEPCSPDTVPLLFAQLFLNQGKWGYPVYFTCFGVWSGDGAFVEVV